jgi:hypothetical protein
VYIAPTNFGLFQNYPNPFNPSTTIRYDIPNDGIVRLKLYSILEVEIMELLNEFKVSGTHTYILNASNLPSVVPQIYLYYEIKNHYLCNTKKRDKDE